METLLFGYWNRWRAIGSHAAHSIRAAAFLACVIAALDFVPPARADDAATGATRALICDELNECLAIVAAENCGIDCPTSDEQLEAARQFRKIGAPAIPALLKLLTHDDFAVRYRASFILNQIDGLTDEDVPALAEAAKSGVPWAGQIIMRIGTPAALRYIVDRLWVSASTNGESGPFIAAMDIGPGIIPYLIERFTCDPRCNPDYFKLAGRVLAKFGESAAVAVAPLVALAMDERQKFSVRFGAIGALGAMGSVAGEAAPEMRILAAGKDIVLSRAAYLVLEGLHDPAAVPFMLARIRHAPQYERPDMVRALFLLKHNAIAAAPDIEGLLYDPNWDVRPAAAELLGWIGDRNAIPHLLNATYGQDWRVVYYAVWSLGVLKAEEARARLTELAADNSAYLPVRQSAEEALGDIDSPLSSTELVEKHEVWFNGLQLGERQNAVPECTLREVQRQGEWTKFDWQALPDKYEVPEGGELRIVNGFDVLIGRLIYRDPYGFESEIVEYFTQGIVESNIGPLAFVALPIRDLQLDILLARVARDAKGQWSTNQLATLPGIPKFSTTSPGNRLVLLDRNWAAAVNNDGTLEWLPCR